MRLLVGMKVWREGEYIEWCLRSVYDVAHRIRIAHGPTRPVYEAGFTNDDTAEKILSFPDPDGKIEMIDRPFWENITEMCNKTLSPEADFYLKLDGDEVPSPEWLEEFLSLIPEATEKRIPITSNYHHFFDDFRTVYAHIPVYDRMYEYRLRGLYHRGGGHFIHPDFFAGIWEDFDGPALRMENRLHHFHRVRSMANIIASLYYSRTAWHNWTPKQLNDLKAKGGYVDRGWAAPQTEPFDGTIPEILHDHPYYPDGIPNDLRLIDWEELLHDNESDSRGDLEERQPE